VKKNIRIYRTGKEMDLSNDNTFKWTVVISAFIGIAICSIAVYLLKKKGVDIGSKKVIFGGSLIVLFMGFFPFWLKADLSLQFKIFVPLISTVLAWLYGSGILRLNKKLHKK
jgi:hypothetical protein